MEWSCWDFFFFAMCYQCVFVTWEGATNEVKAVAHASVPELIIEMVILKLKLKKN